MGGQSAPAPPNYAAATTEGIYADVGTLAARNQVNQAAQLGTKGSVEINGKNISYDFTGLGGEDLARAQTKTSLDLMNEYGTDFVNKSSELTALADPARAALNQNYETKINDELNLGGTLDPSVRREVEQNARAGQASRGNILGDASAYSEAMSTGLAGEARKQQRVANAQATLGLAPVSSQFGNIATATAPIAAAAGAQAGQLNPNAGQNAAQFALGSYGTQSSNYQNAPQNPWMQLAGTAIGTAAGIATKI